MSTKTKTEKTTDFSLKNLTGNLFKSVPNEKTKEKSPNFFGRFNIGGVDMLLSGWVKDTKGSGKFISLTFVPENFSQEEAKKFQENNLAEYLEAKKEKENEGKYILMNGSGTLHPDPKGGFFGSLMYNGELIRVTGINTKAKDSGISYIFLKKSEGRFTEDEKKQMNNDFLTV